MIAETIGGFDYNAANELRARYEKAKKEKPRCANCKARLAYDRAGERAPLCHGCERKTLANTGETPETAIRREAGYRAAEQRARPGQPLPSLKALREKAGFRQHELAKAAGVPSQRISDVETKGYKATNELITTLARILDVSESELRA